MSTLETQYKNYLKENPEPAFTFEEWSDWKFSNMELPPPHNGLRPIDEHAEELSDWDVTLMDGLENEPPYVSDDFQIGPDGAYEHIEYSIPIYENGIKTEYTVDGIIGDEKYYQLLEFGNGKDLPDMINTTIKQTMNKEQIIDEAYEKYYTTLIDSITFSERGKHFKSNGLEFNSGYPNYVHYSKEEFINKCKTDSGFSERWGLKIEERELSLEERGEWDSKRDSVRNTWGQAIQTFTPNEVRIWLNEKNVPTKLITITYKNETIESYEN